MELFSVDNLLPNEKIIRVFPVRTEWTPDDETAFVGPPPFAEFRPHSRKTPVHVSVTFPQHMAYAEKLRAAWADHYDNVKIGGPAYNSPAGEFIPGRYLKKGCTITSRGCPKKCGWCIVPQHEGELRLLKIQPGWIVQDNNLLACPEPHIRRVFDMLREQGRRIFFNGGLDKHYFQPWHRELFDSIPIGELWFACDVMKDLPWLEKARQLLEGIPQRKLRCYTMIGYDGESLADAEARLNAVFDLGFLPFCQLYQPNDGYKLYDLKWKAVSRAWSRPAAIFSMKEVLTLTDTASPVIKTQPGAASGEQNTLDKAEGKFQ